LFCFCDDLLIDKYILKMRYSKKNLVLLKKNELILIIDELDAKVGKKNGSMRKLQMRLNNAKLRMQKMDTTVRYLRKRILELHE
jgi:hypothetical protein